MNWIATEDRLPFHNQDVIFIVNDNGTKTQHSGHFEQSDGFGLEFWSDNNYSLDNGLGVKVTHWMPSPEDP